MTQRRGSYTHLHSIESFEGISEEDLASDFSSISLNDERSSVSSVKTATSKNVDWESDDDDSNALTRLAKSHNFQVGVGVVIMINTLVMAVKADNQDWQGWPFVENALLIFFVVELLLRLQAYRGEFFTNQDKYWNIFDLTVVLLGVLDLWVIQVFFDLQHAHAKVAKFVTVLRVVRILRILRLLRLFKTFPELHLLALGLVQSIVVVFWISLLFVILMVVAAIFCTTMTGHDADSWPDIVDNPDCNKQLIEEYFGTMLRSMTTLFQFVTLDDWSRIARCVTKSQPFMQIFFIIYILITAFTTLSLLTGVVSEQILAATKKEEEEQTERREEQNQFFREVKKMFKKADHDDSHTITRQEFQDMLQEHDMHVILQRHHIDLEEHFDKIELFDCLDTHRRGELTEHEFREGFFRMRGEAKSKDVLKVQSRLTKLSRKVSALQGQIPCDLHFTGSLNRKMEILTELTTTLGVKLGSLENQFSDFLDYMGRQHRDQKAKRRR